MSSMFTSLMTIVPAARSPKRCESFVSKINKIPTQLQPMSMLPKSHLIKKEPRFGREPSLLITLIFIAIFPGVLPSLKVSQRKSHNQMATANANSTHMKLSSGLKVIQKQYMDMQMTNIAMPSMMRAKILSAILAGVWAILTNWLVMMSVWVMISFVVYRYLNILSANLTKK